MNAIHTIVRMKGWAIAVMGIFALLIVSCAPFDLANRRIKMLTIDISSHSQFDATEEAGKRNAALQLPDSTKPGPMVRTIIVAPVFVLPDDFLPFDDDSLLEDDDSLPEDDDFLFDDEDFGDELYTMSGNADADDLNALRRRLLEGLRLFPEEVIVRIAEGLDDTFNIPILSDYFYGPYQLVALGISREFTPGEDPALAAIEYIVDGERDGVEDALKYSDIVWIGLDTQLIQDIDFDTRKEINLTLRPICGNGGSNLAGCGLPAPSNPRAYVQPHSSRLSITWTAVAGASGYNLYRSQSANTNPSSKVNTDGLITDRQYDIASSSYQGIEYKIGAVDLNGNEGTQSGVVEYFTLAAANPPPAGEDILMEGIELGAEVSGGEIYITWTEVVGANGYKIYKDADFEGGPAATVVNQNAIDSTARRYMLNHSDSVGFLFKVAATFSDTNRGESRSAGTVTLVVVSSGSGEEPAVVPDPPLAAPTIRMGKRAQRAVY